MARLLRLLLLVATCFALIFVPVRWESDCCACEDEATSVAVTVTAEEHEGPCAELCQSCCACCGQTVSVTASTPAPLVVPGASALPMAPQRAPPQVEPEKLLQVPKAA